MLNITPSTLQAINTPNKISEGQYLYQNGTPTDLIIKNTEYKNIGELNTSNMKSLVIDLVGEHDLQGEWFNYVRKLETSEVHSIDYGLFRVIEQEYKIDEDVTVVTLFDKMINTHKEVHKDEFDLAFPTTLGAVFNKVISICELETSTPTFNGHDLPISSDVWTNTSYTYRDVLSQIAEVITAQIQVRDNKVDVYYGEETTIEISNFRTKTLEVGRKIEGFNILNVTQEPQHWNTPYPSDWHTIPIEDRKEYVIQNNAIIDLNRTLYSPIVFNKIKDISYTPFRADTFGWGIFDIGDIVSIKDENGVIHKSIVTSELGNFKQMFLSEVISSKIEHAKDEYVVATDEQRQGQTVYFLVDQQNGIIEGLVNKVDEIEDETARLTIEVDKIETEVKNIHLGNILPNANGSEDYVGWAGDGETLYVDENMLYLQDITYGTVAIPKIIEGSKSEYGWEYYNKGTMYSSYMRVIPEELKYSFRAKTGNFKPIKFTLYEYNEDVREDSDVEPSKETVYNITSPMQYITFTHTNQNDTKFMMLGIEIATATIDSRTTLTEIMFNAREPKEWFESLEDVKQYAYSLRQQSAGEINDLTVEIDEINGDIHNAGLDINARDGVSVFGKHFRVFNENKTKEIFTVETVDGEEGIKMIGDIETTEGDIKIDSKNKLIGIGDVEIRNWTSIGDHKSLEISTENFLVGRRSNENTGISFYDADGAWYLASRKNGKTILRVDDIRTSGTTSTDNLDFWAVPTFKNRVNFDKSIYMNNNFVIGQDNANLSFIRPQAGSVLKALGMNDNRYNSIYLRDQPNVSSDIRLKNKILPIDNKLIDIFGKEVEPRTYMMKDSDQIHFGYIAQDVERALYKYILSKHGLNRAKEEVNRFAVLSKSESYLSLLYGEIAVIMDAYNRMRMDKLEKRIEALERND